MSIAFDPDSIVGAFKLTGTPYDPDDTITSTPVPDYNGDDDQEWVITQVSYHRGWEAPCVSVYIMNYSAPEVGFLVRPLLTEAVF